MEVSCAVRRFFKSLGFKWLSECQYFKVRKKSLSLTQTVIINCDFK